MPKVFLSSTARDLSEHRRAVIAAIRRLDGYQCVCMEDFGARDSEADDFCRAKVGECDLFVGILGHFYGSCPMGSQRSFTEREYEVAIEVAKPRLMFLAVDSFPMPANLRESQDKSDAQQAFRKRVILERILETFLLPEELALKVTQAIRNYEQGMLQEGKSFKPSLAPPAPLLIIGREDALRDLKNRLGITGKRAEAPPVQILTAMRGWPGIGKTTLATALANDTDITKAFPHGHLWASLGTKPDLFSELDSWARALGMPDLLHEKTLEKASRRMAAVLRNRRVLLIIDDVWDAQHARTLMVGGPECATLITTRNTSVANALATPENIYVLERLSDDSSLELLGRLAPQVVQDYRKECLNLAHELEGLPLALQVAGRMLHAEESRGWNVRDLLRELRSGAALLEKEAPPDMADLVNQTTPTIVALLKKSTDLLDDTTRERFALLGVVKEKPATFDSTFMRAQWLTDDPKPTADVLIDRGLLEPVGNHRFTMHALLVALAYSMLEK